MTDTSKNFPAPANTAAPPDPLPDAGRSARHRGTSPRADRYFHPAALEVLERPPSPWPRAILLLIISFAAALIIWATYARMDIVITATGTIIPSGKAKVIQPFTPGVITAIHIHDGQRVQAGERLITIDDSENLAEIGSLSQELERVDLTIMRLKALLQNEPTLFNPNSIANRERAEVEKWLLNQSLDSRKERVAALDAEIRRADAELAAVRSEAARLHEARPLSSQLYEKKKALARQQLISEVELIQARMDMNEIDHSLATIIHRQRETEEKLTKAKLEKSSDTKKYRQDLLDQLSAAWSEKENLKLQHEKAMRRQDHFELTAPVSGIVQQLSVNTIGGVVTSAQPLMVIVPEGSGLEVDARVLDRDVGFIARGQEVSVKVAAYSYIRYGALAGRIEWIGGDAVVDEALGPYYPARISIDEYELPNIVNGKKGVITPGMTVSTDIKVGKRRVIEYFLGPIMRYRDESLKEL